MASPPSRENALAERVYTLIKEDIFSFRLLPGDRFTETEMAQRCGASRTPVRDALYRLEREGYLHVAFRSGWRVRPLDFERFEQLYDLRIVLEAAAVTRICEAPDAVDLTCLQQVWLTEPAERVCDPQWISQLDEGFHQDIVAATGNREMAQVHQELTEKIRIIRRLDFTRPARIQATYEEHAQILRLLMQHRATQATLLLRAHIEASKAEVRKITLHTLHRARGAPVPAWTPHP